MNRGLNQFILMVMFGILFITALIAFEAAGIRVKEVIK